MNRTFYYTILIFVVVAFYMMNSYEPLRCDDLIYQYYWLSERTNELKEPIDLSNRIDNVFEAFDSQINHYYVMNGRFVVHFLVSCFCGFLGRPLFSILNTVIYLLFIIGCVKLLDIQNYVNSATAVAIIWFGLPIQYILWYSVAFAINYLWVSTVLVYFFILIKYLSQNNLNNSIFKLVTLFLFGLVFGAMHEGFSLPLSVAMLIFVVLNRKTINKRHLLLALGLWIGTAVVVLAPGTIGRGAGSLSSVNFGELVLMKLDVLRYSKRLYLFVILLILCFIFNKERFVCYIRNKQLAIYFITIDFFFVLAVPHYSQRIEFPLELVSLLLSLDIIMNSRFIENCKKQLCSLFVVLLLIHVPLTVYYAKLTSKEYSEMLNVYLESTDGVTYYCGFEIPKLCGSYVHRLDDGVEKDFISFVYKKEMHLKNNKN